MAKTSTSFKSGAGRSPAVRAGRMRFLREQDQSQTADAMNQIARNTRSQIEHFRSVLENMKARRRHVQNKISNLENYLDWAEGEEQRLKMQSHINSGT